MLAREVGRVPCHETLAQLSQTGHAAARHCGACDATSSHPCVRWLPPLQKPRATQAVKAVAIALGKQTKRNEFGGVYGELYRRYGITGYKMLPAYQFAEAMEWLSEWYANITDGDDVPF